jgi:hypothetical protein
MQFGHVKIRTTELWTCPDLNYVIKFDKLKNHIRILTCSDFVVLLIWTCPGFVACPIWTCPNFVSLIWMCPEFIFLHPPFRKKPSATLSYMLQALESVAANARSYSALRIMIFVQVQYCVQFVNWYTQPTNRPLAQLDASNMCKRQTGFEG